MDITTAQKVLAAVEFKDAAGLVTAAPGPIVWSVNNPEFVSLTPSADGMSCEVVSIAAGAATITAISGSVVITGDVTVSDAVPVPPPAPVPGPAVSGTMTFSAPVAK